MYLPINFSRKLVWESDIVVLMSIEIEWLPWSNFFIFKNIYSFQQLRHLIALYWTYLYKKQLKNFPGLHVGDTVLYLCPFLYQQPQFLKQDQNNLRSHFTRVKNLFPFEWLFSYGHFPVVSK